jgi:hypothetical protein
MLVYPIHGNNPKNKPQLPDPPARRASYSHRLILFLSQQLRQCRALAATPWRTEITRSYLVRFTSGMKRTVPTRCTTRRKLRTPGSIEGNEEWKEKSMDCICSAGDNFGGKSTASASADRSTSAKGPNSGRAYRFRSANGDALRRPDHQ